LKDSSENRQACTRRAKKTIGLLTKITEDAKDSRNSVCLFQSLRYQP